MSTPTSSPQPSAPPKSGNLVVARFKGYGWADEPHDRSAIIAPCADLMRVLWDDALRFQAVLSNLHAKWQAEEEERLREEERRWEESGIEVSREGGALSYTITLDTSALEEKFDELVEEQQRKQRPGILKRLFGKG